MAPCWWISTPSTGRHVVRAVRGIYPGRAGRSHRGGDHQPRFTRSLEVSRGRRAVRQSGGHLARRLSSAGGPSLFRSTMSESAPRDVDRLEEVAAVTLGTQRTPEDWTLLPLQDISGCFRPQTVPSPRRPVMHVPRQQPGQHCINRYSAGTIERVRS